MQGVVQVAAMEREIGRAVARFDRGAERMIVGDFAGISIAVERCRRGERNLPHALLDAQAAMHLERVRALLDAGADARKLLRLLIDLGHDAALEQRRCERETTDAGTDDRDGRIV